MKEGSNWPKKVPAEHRGTRGGECLAGGKHVAMIAIRAILTIEKIAFSRTISTNCKGEEEERRGFTRCTDDGP